jgi:hypothetical protein
MSATEHTSKITLFIMLSLRHCCRHTQHTKLEATANTVLGCAYFVLLQLTDILEHFIFDHAHTVDVTPKVVATFTEQRRIKHERRVTPQNDVTVKQEGLLEPTSSVQQTENTSSAGYAGDNLTARQQARV